MLDGRTTDPIETVIISWQRFFQQGEPADFGLVVQAIRPSVKRVCLAELRRDDLAEDACQATLLILLRKRPKFRSELELHGWTFSTARLVCRNLQRSERRRIAYEQEAMTVQTRSTEHDDGQIGQVLQQELARLAEKDRQVLLMRFYAGSSIQEVATALKITTSAAQMRINRALERLKGRIQRSHSESFAVAALGCLQEPTDLAVTAWSAGAASTQVNLLAQTSMSALGWIGFTSLAKTMLATALACGATSVLYTFAAPLHWPGSTMRANHELGRDLAAMVVGEYHGTHVVQEPLDTRIFRNQIRTSIWYEASTARVHLKSDAPNGNFSDRTWVAFDQRPGFAVSADGGPLRFKREANTWMFYGSVREVKAGTPGQYQVVPERVTVAVTEDQVVITNEAGNPYRFRSRSTLNRVR